jgi:hypothetical protein
VMIFSRYWICFHHNEINYFVNAFRDIVNCQRLKTGL